MIVGTARAVGSTMSSTSGVKPGCGRAIRTPTCSTECSSPLPPPATPTATQAPTCAAAGRATKLPPRRRPPSSKVGPRAPIGYLHQYERSPDQHHPQGQRPVDRPRAGADRGPRRVGDPRTPAQGRPAGGSRCPVPLWGLGHEAILRRNPQAQRLFRRARQPPASRRSPVLREPCYVVTVPGGGAARPVQPPPAGPLTEEYHGEGWKDSDGCG